MILQKKFQLPSPSGSGVLSGQNFIRVAKLCRKIITPHRFCSLPVPAVFREIHTEADQHCRAEDCFVDDME